MRKNLLFWGLALALFASCSQADPGDGQSASLPAPQKIAPPPVMADEPAAPVLVAPVKPKRKHRPKRILPEAEPVYNAEAFAAFQALAQVTDGEASKCGRATRLPKHLVDLLEKHAKKGTDLVFLIDNTGSMGEEIDQVKSSLTKLCRSLKNIPDLRVAAATYADSTADGPGWFRGLDFTRKLGEFEDFVEDITLGGGGDLPESVYDGIWRVTEQFDWRSDTKRMIVVIGDAPPQEGKMTIHARDEIETACRKKGIAVNLYPVLVSL